MASRCLPSLMRKVAVPCEQVLWTCEPSPAKSPTWRIKAKGVAFFAVCSTSVAGRSHPLRQGNEGWSRMFFVRFTTSVLCADVITKLLLLELVSVPCPIPSILYESFIDIGRLTQWPSFTSIFCGGAPYNM